MDKTLYNPTQAAKATGVSRQSVYYWLATERVIPEWHDADGRPLFTLDEIRQLRLDRGKRTKR